MAWTNLIPALHHEFMLPITPNQLPNGTLPLDCYNLVFQNNKWDLVKQTDQIYFDFDTVTQDDRELFLFENQVEVQTVLVGSTLKPLGKPLVKSQLCAVHPAPLVSALNAQEMFSAWYQGKEYYLDFVVSEGDRNKPDLVPVSLALVP
jgi:hypothetical protein